MRMRIAYIINSLEGGGAALPIPSICRVMRDHGAEIRVFALTARDARALPSLRAAGLDVAVREGGERDHAAATLWLDQQVRDWVPSVLITSLTRATLLGQLVGLRRSVPVASWQHAAYLKPANAQLLRLSRHLSGMWISDSASVGRWTEQYLGVSRARLVEWPIFRADPVVPQANLATSSVPIRIGSLGRLHPVKGYDVLIEALADLGAQGADIQVCVGGDGPARPQLEALAHARGLKTLRFLGYVGNPQDFLAGLHLYVQPSRSEGFCIAAHQAMQAGLPVIASGVGELSRTIVQGRTGVTVPPGDPIALATALRRLLAAREGLSSMGAAARCAVLEAFGPERFAAAGAAVVERLRDLQVDPARSRRISLPASRRTSIDTP